jgi:hypothetical protein
MRKLCPECSKYFNGRKCNCGYEIEENSHKQERVPVKLSNGKTIMVTKCDKFTCQNPGTMSFSTNHKNSDEAKFYCQDHFRS